jgi:hypothetical protein
MVSTEKKMSISDESFANFTVSVKKYIRDVLNARGTIRIDYVAELFDYMIITKEIWRFHHSIILYNSFINMVLYIFTQFRKPNGVSVSDNLRVCSILENMEHRLDLLCSATTQKNKLCRNKLSHSTMLMCTMHKNKEFKKTDLLKIIFEQEIYFPSVLTRLISLYIFS